MVSNKLITNIAIFVGSILISLPAGFALLNLAGLIIGVLLCLFTWHRGKDILLYQPFLVIIVLRFLLDTLQITTWNPLVIPVAIFVVMALFKSEVRCWLRSVLSTGHLSYWVAIVAVVTVILSAASLMIWEVTTKPDLSEKLRMVPDFSLLTLIFLGIGFSVVNAFVEEIIFRGIIWRLLLDQRFNVVSVWLQQTILFGLLHYTGFPGGLLGSILAGGYAALLGYLRILNNGILIPIITHIFADITIFTIVLKWGGRI